MAYFDRFLHYFFTDEEADFFACLGLNCIRVPFSYRQFVDDADSTILRFDSFKLLDNIVNICERHELYVILDLHSVPGGQNQDWHLLQWHLQGIILGLQGLPRPSDHTLG
jgi:aryl-phospho-beta-D-glucosidase BglC (GH1 family)